MKKPTAQEVWERIEETVSDKKTLKLIQKYVEKQYQENINELVNIGIITIT